MKQSTSKPILVTESDARRIIESCPRNRDSNRQSFLDRASIRPYASKTCAKCGARKSRNGTVCWECYRIISSVKVSLSCHSCGKKFARELFNYRKSITRGCINFFCSAKCSWLHHSKKRKQCLVCGEYLPDRHMKFCSVGCRRKDTAPMKKRVYRGQSYTVAFREIRPIVLKRDGFKCMKCGTHQKFKKTRVVGAKPVSNLIVHHRNQDIHDNRMRNLLTMCRPCHASHHKFYGQA